MVPGHDPAEVWAAVRTAGPCLTGARGRSWDYLPLFDVTNAELSWRDMRASFFTDLLSGSPVHTVEVRPAGYVIRPAPGRQTDFDLLVRLVTQKASPAFVAIPTPNSVNGWSSLMLMPVH